MRGDQKLRAEALQLLRDPSEFGGIRPAQMHAADDGMNGALVGELADIFQRVNDAGMRATQQNHQTGGGVEKQRLVIPKRVRGFSVCIQIKCSGCRFFGVRAGDFAGLKQAGNNFQGAGCRMESDIGLLQSGARGGRQADVARLPGGHAVLGFKRGGMEVDVYCF